MRRSKIPPTVNAGMMAARKEAEERQAYAAGYSAGQIGVATNPHPAGTELHKLWRNGYNKARSNALR